MSDCYCDTLRRATRKMTARYDAALAGVGLTIAQFALLRKIQRAGETSLTALGRRAGLDRSTIGRNVRVLEKAGLVALSTGVDQREATVTLTDQGADALASAVPLWSEAQAAIEAVLGPDGASVLARMSRDL